MKLGKLMIAAISAILPWAGQAQTHKAVEKSAKHTTIDIDKMEAAGPLAPKPSVMCRRPVDADRKD